MRSTVRTVVATATVALVALSVSIAPAATAAAAPAGEAQAASAVVAPAAAKTAEKFSPGNIIEDAVFFDRTTMTAAQIQAFFSARVKTCTSGYTCLKSYKTATTTRAADAMCRSTYTGGSSETAAQIVYKVSQACGINPRVLIVMLQKEQGLVTSTAPSATRYKIAMGQGCPDTAACDSQYYGFFNQVYGAAHQLKRYANPPGTSQYFTWYAPGKTWNILYNPKSSCGTSKVLIQNQATANLYYYTPYQPNAAALAAGYGTGDSCSSYGNRNFFNYFTDWFGSTRVSNVNLVRTEADPTVYLVSGTKRYTVLDGEEYAALVAVFGPTYVVSTAFVANLTDAGVGGAVLRDESSGEIFLIQGGTRHLFPTCELVSLWGASCTAQVNVSSDLLSRVPRGDGVSAFARASGTGQLLHIDSTTAVTPLWDAKAAVARYGVATLPTTFVLRSAVLAKRTSAPLVFAPTQLVRTVDDPQVYLTDGYSRLLAVSSWADVAEYGRTSADVVRVSSAQLSAGYTASGSVSPIVQCSGASYLVVGGKRMALAHPESTGLRTTALAADTCAQLPVSASKIDGALFVKSAASDNVFQVDAGERVIMATMADVNAINGGGPLTIVTVLASTLAAIPLRAPIPDGSIAKSSSAATLWAVNGMTRNAIPSMAMARELGLPIASYKTYAPHVVALLAAGPSLGLWVTCGGSTYVAAGGSLHAVTAPAAAGFTAVTVAGSLCAQLTIAPDATRSAVFVKGSGSRIYKAEGGVYRPVASWGALLAANGGTAPVWLTLSDTVIATLPLGKTLN